MTATQIEKRLTALETEVARLKSPARPKNHWWNKIAGVFADDPLFEQAMRHGRSERESHRPAPRAAKNGRAKKRGTSR